MLPITNPSSSRAFRIFAKPSFQPWSLRSIGLRDEQALVGYIGFHTQPGAAYLQNISSTGVEYGYRVNEAYQRQGYAREASRGLMGWAHEEHDVAEFVVTISLDNLPSNRLAKAIPER